MFIVISINAEKKIVKKKENFIYINARKTRKRNSFANETSGTVNKRDSHDRNVYSGLIIAFTNIF